MAAAYAALRSLKCTLHTIKNMTRFSISIDKKQIQSLQDRVDFLIYFLEDFSHTGNEKAQNLENRIADAAHNAEDAIELHVADEITRNAKMENWNYPDNSDELIDFRRANKKARHLVNQIAVATHDAENNALNIENLIDALDFLMRNAMEMKEMSAIRDWQSGNSSVHVDLSSPPPIGRTSMVGFDDELLSIKDRLTENQSNQLIISIVGMGGIGKTTLIKSVYEDKLIVQHFDIRVWVTISQVYDVKRIFFGVLCNIRKQKMDCRISEDQLGVEIHKSLIGRRYLVVMDDMWEIEAWERIQSCFPDNENGSRTVVTTRSSDLATNFSSCIYRLNFLDLDKSWNLLHREVFGEEDCPVELEDIGKKIATKCKGLPLSIVVIGGLLSKSTKTKDYWEYVANDLNSIANLEDDERTMKILSLSYHNLPIHLKPCFLYMGAFPEDEKIAFSIIIKLWVAEGFLKPMIDKDFEEVGEEYLKDLLSRNLLINDDDVDRRWLSDKYFKIHDILRDVCLRECQSQMFLNVQCLDKFECTKSLRRISNHKNTSEGESTHRIAHARDSASCLRSLLCHNQFPLIFIPLGNPKLLRVLDTYYEKDHYSVAEITSMVNSRYISLSTHQSTRVKLSSSSLNLLWNLQSLRITGLGECKFVAPSEIWKMTQLRHVEVWELCLPDPSTDTRDNFVLENLHTLSKVLNFRCAEEVVKRIPNIKRLKMSGGCEEHYFKNIGCLLKLEWLHSAFRPMHTLSRTMFQAFPISLKELILSNIEFDWVDMTHIGSLPYLEVLILSLIRKCTPVWEPIEGEFSRLKYLLIDNGDLVEWRVDNTHFPRLERLYFADLKKLEEIPLGIGDITTLQSISLFLCSESSVLSAKAILDYLEELGEVDLEVRVTCIETEELKSSLTNSNFTIHWRRPWVPIENNENSTGE